MIAKEIILKESSVPVMINERFTEELMVHYDVFAKKHTIPKGLNPIHKERVSKKVAVKSKTKSFEVTCLHTLPRNVCAVCAAMQNRDSFSFCSVSTSIKFKGICCKHLLEQIKPRINLTCPVAISNNST